MPIAISANYLDIDFPNGLSLDQKIEVFGDRVIGWQLKPAQRLIESDPNSGFAVLHILLSYFETIAKFHEGYCNDKDSAVFFKKGLKWFISSLTLTQSEGTDLSLFDEDHFYSYIYHQVRCGLYHSAMTGVGIFVTGEVEGVMKYTMKASGEFAIDLNPKQMIRAIEEHLKAYLRSLRNPENADLRSKFEARFNWLENSQSSDS